VPSNEPMVKDSWWIGLKMASFWRIAAVEEQKALAEPRRYLVLSLPRWATDCLKRADPALAQSGRPLALWERQKGAMRLAAVDHLAAAEGLRPEQSLSDARAMVPGLELREIDRTYLEQVFADFADWHSNASPIVSVLADISPFGDLVLDITGVTHLFGGESKMLSTLTNRLEVLGFTVAGAIAPTVGAAWAMAHLSPGRIVATGDERSALAMLPVAALRLDEARIDSLCQMGLKQVGQLYDRDRKALQARFGLPLLNRLDQALGLIEERITPRIPVAERFAERRFPEPIGLIDDVLMTARDLAIQLSLRLETEGLGGQSFHLFLYRVDHKVMTLSVNAARAIRDAGHISRLFANRAERLIGEYDAGFGIDMIRLAASSLSHVDSVQLDSLGRSDGADLDRLYDRMTSRLGPLAVVRSKFVNTHIPERAVKLEPVIARTPDDPHAMPDASQPRPVRLLPAPEPIVVSLAGVPDGPPPNMIWRRVSYRFVKVSGPERIGIEWWTPRSKDGQPPDDAGFTRDYFVAEDESGRRFWLFREGLYQQGSTPRWFLHGFFA
jgi:protein ImuB